MEKNSSSLKSIITTLYMVLLLVAVMVPVVDAASVPPMIDGCATSVYHLDVECTDGDIITDTYSGSCRTIVCEGIESSMQVLACDKPGLPRPEYYEVYRQSVSGDKISEICVGDACVGSRGFAMGDMFPICGETTGTDAYCGDGIVNQEWEQCDGTAGTYEGYRCSANCELMPISQDECVIDHRTQTQGGWGTGASGENPGAYRDDNFDGAFPNGIIIGIEGEYRALFETTMDVENFLPQGGPSEAFNADYLNPLTTNAGVLAGQALSLKLSLGFDAYDPNFSGSDTPLADLIVGDESSECFGMSVQEVMDEADLVLAGMGTVTPTQIETCLALINENFVDGTTDRGNLICPPLDEEPVCPLYIGNYDYVIDIYERLRTDKAVEDSLTSKIPVSIAPGTYAVTLVGDDGYPTRDEVTQPNEQYALKFYKDSSSVGMTSATSDLEDYVKYAQVIEIVDNNFVLSEGADQIQGVQPFYPADSPNSINAVCVGLKKVKEVQELSCEEAIEFGLLYGSIEAGNAVVHNEAWLPFEVSLVSYEMPSGLISDQVLFDYETKVVQPKSYTELSVEVPECAYQIDLVCGKPLQTNPEYGDRMIASEFGNKGDYCEKKSDGNAELSIAPWYPKDNNYIFVCETDFEATSYSWYFGNGKMLLNIANNNVYHTFQNPGVYAVTCEATDGDMTASDTMLVNVAPWNGLLV
jgi:hypothetical protein